MARKDTGKMMETDLYKPVCEFFTAQGYVVRGEVKNCDITALRGEELVVVELKTGMSLTLVSQAVQRQKISDLVYVAVPYPKRGIYSKGWKDILHLLRRLELGLILVKLTGKKPGIEVVLSPEPFDRLKSIRRSKSKRHSIIQEIENRSGDYNTGGSSRQKLVTAYKENVIHIACCMELLGPVSPKQLRALGTGKKTLSILSKNYYQWFVHPAKGIYSLSEAGSRFLMQSDPLIEHYRKLVRECVDKKD